MSFAAGGENFQDFSVGMTFFIRKIAGFTWYIGQISPCGAIDITKTHKLTEVPALLGFEINGVPCK